MRILNEVLSAIDNKDLKTVKRLLGMSLLFVQNLKVHFPVRYGAKLHLWFDELTPAGVAFSFAP